MPSTQPRAQRGNVNGKSNFAGLDASPPGSGSPPHGSGQKIGSEMIAHFGGAAGSGLPPSPVN